jgi:4-alpha-glucanotransferase
LEYGSFGEETQAHGDDAAGVRAGAIPEPSMLDALGERAGIEDQFVDAHGNLRRTTADTKRALLATMGVAAGDEAAASKSLAALDHAEWGRALPPAHVVCPARGPLSIPLSLPAGTGTVSWRLRLEDGAERQGACTFGSLSLMAQEMLDGRVIERRALWLDAELPSGYHSLAVQPGDATCSLIVTPGRCWLPPPMAEGRRLWGLAAQLYLLRSQDNWGIGDYADLARLVETLSARGADVVGLNPLHAMFLDDPEHASPYSPASRLLLNILNIDVAGLPELAACAEAQAMVASAGFQQRLAACRASSLVDYTAVTALKLEVLQRLFEDFRTNAELERRQAFDRFRQERGAVFERSCLFQALRQHFAAQGPERADWRSWPEPYQDPSSPAVARFAQEHEALLTFRIWMQWLADRQLAAAATATGGMAVGLYRDLAVGADPSGAETWASQRAVVSGAQVGAPPDIYNTAGQDWGLPPFHPRALREEGYASFIELVRANMRHAGGLRIDHVMALQHLYWVPKGRSPADGAYVRYPLEDLVGILALESQRNRCLVVGEDLGTVPAGFRERMAEAGILSYRVLFFEKGESGFLPPEQYPDLALAVVGSHDLPTLRGWWEGADIDLRNRLHLFPDADAVCAARAERAEDRRQLRDALDQEGLLSPDRAEDTEAVVEAAHRFLARSRSGLAIVQIDDLTGEVEPVNVPTTSDEHPNWRRRLSLSVEELARHPRFLTVTAAIAAERETPPRAER